MQTLRCHVAEHTRYEEKDDSWRATSAFGWPPESVCDTEGVIMRENRVNEWLRRLCCSGREQSQERWEAGDGHTY